MSAVVRSSSTPSAATLESALALDLIALGAAAGGNLLLAARANASTIALVLVAAAVGLRLVQYRAALRSIPLHLPWLLFIATALVGVFVSYDFQFSLRKFYLILGGIGLYYALATTQTATARRLVVWGLLLVCAAIAIFYLTQTDFSAQPIKIGALNQLGLQIHSISPQFGLRMPHPNLIAGILLLGLPYSVALAYAALRGRRWFAFAAAAFFILLLGLSLLMTTSRGAWLALVALAAGGTVVYIAVALARRAGLSARVGIAAGLNLILVGLLLIVIIGGARLGSAVIALLGSASGVPRPQLYTQVTQLIQDYVFTGAGLDTFSPNFSTYTLLINVPFLPHAHNLFLQVWLEQGILGLVAFVWLILAYYVWVIRRSARMNGLALASVAVFTLILLHGLTDVIFYFSRVISLMFIPLGLTVSALKPFEPLPSALAVRSRRPLLIGAGALAALLVVAALLAFGQRAQLLASWYANRGAVAQAQAELPAIQLPVTASQVRRRADLTRAQDFFQRALQLDPQNRVAHSRLGLIALDRYDFPQAVTHLEAAYRADKTNRAVVKALGYAYTWTARYDEALPLLRQIPEAALELGYSAADWQKLGRADLARSASLMVQRLK